MCTILLAWRVFDDAPVVFAANRDEAIDRPSTPPRIQSDDGRRFLAPRDDRAGGTWVGVGEDRVLVALANRWMADPIDGARSRGLLVRDALTASSASAAAEMVSDAVAATPHAGFNLVTADAESAWLLEWSGSLRRTRLDDGVHVVVNVGADGRYEIPATRREMAERQAAGATQARSTLLVGPDEQLTAWRDRAKAMLSDHDSGFCVHGDGYGTRSSSLVTVFEDGAIEYEFADGAPCESEHSRVDGHL